jgi:hypothetical protein
MEASEGLLSPLEAFLFNYTDFRNPGTVQIRVTTHGMVSIPTSQMLSYWRMQK